MSKDPASKGKVDQGDGDFSGQKKGGRLKLGRLEKTLTKHKLEVIKETKEKRIYRQNPEDLNDPESDPKSEANRLTVRLSTRVSRAYESAFNSAASKYPSKRAALERAIELLVNDLGDGPE
ncbi:MAG: hypothetical protein ABJL67_12675 [Sulfitobacter sp.]